MRVDACEREITLKCVYLTLNARDMTGLETLCRIAELRQTFTPMDSSLGRPFLSPIALTLYDHVICPRCGRE